MVHCIYKSFVCCLNSLEFIITLEFDLLLRYPSVTSQSEVAEWKEVDRTFQNDAELGRKKLRRKKEVMDVKWKGDRTAKIMQHGFGFLEKDRSTLENLGGMDIKRFFDTLCHLFEAS